MKTRNAGVQRARQPRLGTTGWIAAGLLGVALAYAGAVAGSESALWRLDRAVAATSAGDPHAPAQLRALLNADDSPPGPRRELLTAAGLAMLGRLAPPGPERVADLGEAGRMADALARTNPDRADAFVLSSYARSVASGRIDAIAIAQVARSYRIAPFLREQAPWRLTVAGSAWYGLMPMTQAAALDEALWYARLGRDERRLVERVFTGSPPYVTIALRLPGAPGASLPPPTVDGSPGPAR